MNESTEVRKKLMQEKREQDELRRSKEVHLYDFDATFSTVTSLPGRPDKGSILPSPQKKIARKVKIIHASLDPSSKAAAKEGDFSYLPGMLGRDEEGGDESLVPDIPTTIVEQSAARDDGAKAGVTTVMLASDADEVDRIMQSIRTGEDVINFFARYGSDTPLKFVNLVRVTDPREFRPYDLVVADVKDSNTEYYSTSPSGIVHVIPGQSSECFSLANWTRQTMMFRILRKIPFYKNYLHRKAFTAWRANVRFGLFARQRKNVADRLFLARDSTYAAVLQIKKHLIDVKTMRLLSVDSRTSEKDVYVDQQNASLTKIGHQFEDYLRHIIREVQSVLSAVQNVHGKAIKDMSGVDYTTDSLGNPEKAKSLVQLREEKEQRKLMKQRARFEFGSLPDFIRFIDYLVVETLVSLVVKSIQIFYEELIKPRTAGVFEATVRFNSKGTYFSPTSQELTDSLMKLFENMINTISGINRVVYLNAKTSTVGPNVQSILRDSRVYNQTIELIKEKIMADYERAEEHSVQFDPVRPIYDFNLTWDFEAYRTQQHDIASLKSMMELFSNWSKELEKLRNKTLGILVVDSRRLKGELNPIREARLFEIKEYIKDIARERCRHLLDHYKECINELRNRPVSLKDYANYVKSVATLRDAEKNLFKATSQVDQLYNLLQFYEVNVPVEDLTLHEDLHERQHDYRKDFDVAVAYKDSKIMEMTSSVEVNISKLTEQVAGIVVKLDEHAFLDVGNFQFAEKVVEDLVSLQGRLDSCEQLANTYSEYQHLFGASVFEYTDLANGKERLDGMRKMWEFVKTWMEKQTFWLTSEFALLPVEDVDKEIQVFFKDAYALHKKLNNPISEKLRDMVSELKGMMPSVLDLGNPNMKARHWEKIFKAVNVPYSNDMPFPLSLLIDSGIMMFKDLVGETSGSASGEAQLDDSLSKIQKVWDVTKFVVLNHRDQPGLYVLGSLEEVFTALEDNQVTLQTMLGSRFISTIQDRVEEWAKKLAQLSETLDEWVTCQRNWMYLENIFGAEDIQKQLPAESQKFLIVDRSWKQIMGLTNTNPLVINAINPLDNGMTLLDTFVNNNKALESVQKSLEDYLETKRRAFPRFYFLSNDELLEIMSQTRDPHAVQAHMSKCFDAIKRIKFGEGRAKADILGFIDPDGEYVALIDPCKAEGPVESWLLNFELGMRTSLYINSKRAVEGYPVGEEGEINRKEWLWSWPAQVVISIDQVKWTFNADKALRTLESGSDMTAMQHFLDFSLKQIDAMVDLVRSQLTRHQRTLICALLTIDVHARDVTRALVAKEVKRLSDFEWTKQLRYYWAPTNDEKEFDVYARQTITSFRYGYEYLGNGPRLVITPLTDLAYMTLTGALHMKLGGAPAGM